MSIFFKRNTEDKNENREAVRNDFIELMKDNSRRIQEKQDRMNELDEKLERALDTLNQATERYQSAKARLDADGLIKAKADIEAAKEVVDMIRQAITREKGRSAYTMQERQEVIRKIQKYAAAVNDDADKMICSYLAEMREIIQPTHEVIKDCNDFLMREIGDTAHYVPVMSSKLVQNMESEIKHAFSTIKRYYPEKFID